MDSIHCKICKSPIESTTTLKNSRVFYHCGDCGFISLDPKHYLSPEKEKARYDLHENSADNSGYIELLQAFIQTAIKPYPVKQILDYGSGPNPILATLLKAKAYEVDIYDPYYAPWDTTNNSTYDMIVSTESFEHFQDPVRELELMCRQLRPQGYLAIMTSFACQREEFKAWRYKDDATHISFYTPASFQKLAEQFSMEIIYHNSLNIIVLRSAKL